MKILTDRIREEMIQLICREVTGRMTDADRLRLRQLEHDYGIKKLDRLRVAQRLRQDTEFGYTPAWEDFRKHAAIKIQRAKHRRFLIRIGITVAAMVVVAVGIGLLAGGFQKNRLNEPLLSRQIISPGKSVATITLADGEQVELGQANRSLCEENGTLLKMDSAVVTYQKVPVKSPKIVYHSISIPVGGEYQLVLADGTKVWMNADSKMKYPVAFIGERREVFLEGEAYFEVKKDPLHPFIVHTSRGNIEVLGTGFNVRDYPEEAKVVTTLVEGSVAYCPVDGEEGIRLTPGYQLEDSEGTAPTIRQVDVEMFVGWKDGKYIFENTTLEEIMQVLAKWYDIVVFYKREDVKNLHFTGDLERYENINDFLQFMEVGGNVTFNVQGRTVIIE